MCLGFALLLLSRTAAMAWGPHPAITQAALDALGTNHPLKLLLGEHARRLTNHCWLADFKRLPFRDVDQDFYADDYLLFPGVTSHLDHICPEVRKSYAPYFKRALQALRTESPANAARWIGSFCILPRILDRRHMRRNSRSDPFEDGELGRRIEDPPCKL